ncbi:hypothetical protein [Nonomuraea dietziae]|uniref:hypothetical protein n=1 Tax=Nonomuraea dietziae TaxID=65515 RepID=UPI0033E8EFD5
MAEIEVLDLDAARASRSSTQGQPIPLKFGGSVICLLPAELPVDVLEPLAHVKVDTALIARTALDAMQSDDALKAGLDVFGMIVDLVIANPNLPGELLDAVRMMGRRLMGDEGYEAFVAERPSIGDVTALLKGLGGRYGFRLGESQPSLDGSASGETSTPTSSIEGGTSPESGYVLDSVASSPLDGSSTSLSGSLPPLE